MRWRFGAPAAAEVGYNRWMPHAPKPHPSAQPRPRLAGRIAGLRPSLYARILHRIEAHGGEVFPFHIGESHLSPAPQIRDALREASEDRGIHRYASPQGLLPLREAIAERLHQRGRPDVSRDDVVVTHGATHGLSLVCQAVLDPGDEVLVLSPHWPLINGMIHTACAVPVEVPFTTAPGGAADGPRPELLSRFVTPRTRAVYVTTPNNPDGAVLDRSQLQAIAQLCTTHDLYAFVDEAYERFLYVDAPPPLSSFEGMSERTIGIFTFSKTHRMPGLRVGFVVAPADVRDAVTRLANLSVYNVSLMMQRAALAACGCEGAVEETIAQSRLARDLLCRALSEVPNLQFQVPAGGAYVFANLSATLGESDCYALLERALDHGLVFAPGEGFGSDYGKWARFCFTAMDEKKLARGAERLVALLQSTPAQPA